MSVHTFDAMGTTVSIRIVDGAAVTPARLDDALGDAREAFDALERTFSLYREDSELSRVARGDLQLSETSALVRDAYEVALDWRARTHGAFTPHRPDGVLDLSGTVKAEAISAAGDALRGAGIEAFAVNAGGDILTVGVPEAGSWTTGVVDPDDRSRLLTAVRSDPGLPAVATSGTGERGEHIWRSAGADAGAEIVQATVLAGDIVTADVLATAIVSGGRDALDRATREFPVGVLAVFRDGSLAANPTFTARVGPR